MHLSVDSTKPVAALRRDLERACAANGLRVVAVTDSAARAREAGVASARGSFVVELADPLPQIARDGSAAGASTWRVAGYERPGGGTRLSTMRPSHLVDLLGHRDLGDDALRLERTLESAMREAAGGDAPRGPSGPSTGRTA